MMAKKPGSKRKLALVSSASKDADREHEAREILQKTLEERDPDKRRELAEKALELWPEYTDAFCVLAEASDELLESLAYYQAGMRAARNRLGDEFFREHEGNFWLISETRPYMRAARGCGDCLAELGYLGRAADQYRKLLLLNPEDNQANRFRLAHALIKAGRITEAWELCEAYSEDGLAEMQYARALAAFLLHGSGETADEEARTAVSVNAHIANMLLGREFPDPRIAPFVEPGGKNEASNYFHGWLLHWQFNAGALEWLGRVMEQG